ncbi:MAG: hypothetical protein WKF88_04780 [Ferruginibacter sp.]
MDTKNIEVELRGPLGETGYQKLMSVLQTRGTLINTQNRFLLDYSTFLEGIGERTLDVRVRTTNGKVEIVVKKGKFGGTSREEVSLFPADQNFENTLKFMSMLGYNKAVACDRGITRYVIDDIEFAIQDVNDYTHQGKIHSRFYEAEIMCSNENEKDNAVEKIRAFLSENGLSEFSETDWNSYVKKMNEEANGVFDYQIDSVEKVKKLGQKSNGN